MLCMLWRAVSAGQISGHLCNIIIKEEGSYSSFLIMTDTKNKKTENFLFLNKIKTCFRIAGSYFKHFILWPSVLVYLLKMSSKVIFGERANYSKQFNNSDSFATFKLDHWQYFLWINFSCQCTSLFLHQR